TPAAPAPARRLKRDGMRARPHRRAPQEGSPGIMTAFVRSTAAAIAIGVVAAGPASALDEVTFGTNWLAQAEHGGYYQAIADGTYEDYGLDVTIRQGGPQAANRTL